MEANFFRLLAFEAEKYATGRRIEKIFGPAPDVWTFRLDSRQPLRFLIYRPAKSAGLFFFTDQKPVNPAQPPARVMWYRKRVSGRRILNQFVDWPSLSLAWELSPRDAVGHGRYLIFSIRDDLSLADELPAAFTTKPSWPTLDQALAPEVWQDYPQISPPLRLALAAKNSNETAPFYQQIQAGTSSKFYLASEKNAFPLLWASNDFDENSGNTFDSAMKAATVHGERTLFPQLDNQELSPERAKLKRARKKIRRALARLDKEQLVLDERRALKPQAEALQAEMYRLKELEDVNCVTAIHPEHGPLEIELDPKYSIVENMERFFKLAAKAERGYVHLARRKNELGKEMARLESATATLAPEPTPKRGKNGPPPLPKRYQGMAVTLFTSSDGMLILRGRNKKANHQMLSKVASPFDWWFHATNGPSSHVILKRDHPGQDVPQRTLMEAAALCALKSSYRHADRAEIMFALIKDVRKVKGWDHGQVAVDQVLGTVLAEIDEQLEKKLARK